jgi:hypothetical protein
MVAKLNAKYYGKSPSCPCCLLSTEETLAHVFSCDSDGSTEHRLKAISNLQDDLASIKIPPAVTSAIIHGFTMWVHHQTEEDLRVHAPTVGFQRGLDILLTAAFTEQFHSIGWYHFLLGRLSSCWDKAAAAYSKLTDPSYPKVWMAQVISSGNVLGPYGHIGIL